MVKQGKLSLLEGKLSLYIVQVTNFKREVMGLEACRDYFQDIRDL